MTKRKLKQTYKALVIDAVRSQQNQLDPAAGFVVAVVIATFPKYHKPILGMVATHSNFSRALFNGKFEFHPANGDMVTFDRDEAHSHNWCATLLPRAVQMWTDNAEHVDAGRMRLVNKEHHCYFTVNRYGIFCLNAEAGQLPSMFALGDIIHRRTTRGLDFWIPMAQWHRITETFQRFNRLRKEDPFTCWDLTREAVMRTSNSATLLDRALGRTLIDPD